MHYMKALIYLVFGLLFLVIPACVEQNSGNKENKIAIDSINVDDKGIEKLVCTCNQNDSLKVFLKSGSIPNLWETSNNKNFEAWSTSILKPSGKAPEVLSTGEDVSGESEG